MLNVILLRHAVFFLLFLKIVSESEKRKCYIGTVCETKSVPQTVPFEFVYSRSYDCSASDSTSAITLIASFFVSSSMCE